MTEGVVSAIHLHPIKSCHRIEVTTATVSPTGLAGDREWQVAAGDGGPLTQRQKAVLATVRPEPLDGGLRLSAPDQPTIEVARPAGSGAVTTSLTGIEVAAGDAGDDAARWFSQLLDERARLVALAPAAELRPPEAIDLFQELIAFSDLAPVLVANTASLSWLVARASAPFGMDRFRPNLVVTTDEPFAEDSWARFRLGAAELRHATAWPRCSIPQVDQETGERGKEPARVLKAHRWCHEAPTLPEAVRPIFENSGLFGVGCAIGPVGTEISVGDQLVVSETRAPLLPRPSDA